MKQFTAAIFNALKPITKKFVSEKQKTEEQNWYNHPASEDNAQKISKSQAIMNIDEDKEKTQKEKRDTIWMYPIKIRQITSKYGWRIIAGKRNWHNGVDYTGKNKKAQAPTDMIIRKIQLPDYEYPVQFEWISTTAQFQKIESIPQGRAWTPYIEALCSYDTNIVFIFRHVAATVKPGDKIKAGEEFCSIGNFGYSMGAHLHFELYDNAIEQDGDAYISKKISSSKSSAIG